MKLALPMVAALALAAGALHAAPDKPKAGFDALDRNNDGQLSRAEAAGDKRLLKGFDVADNNNDGRLSRGEYVPEMLKKDFRTGKAKLEHAADAPRG